MYRDDARHRHEFGSGVVEFVLIRSRLARRQLIELPTAPSTKGWMRLMMRHGVSEVKSGQRHAIGILFHDAIS